MGNLCKGNFKGSWQQALSSWTQSACTSSVETGKQADEGKEDRGSRAVPEDSPGAYSAVGDGLEHVVHDAGVPHVAVHLLPGQAACHPPPLIHLPTPTTLLVIASYRQQQPNKAAQTRATLAGHGS